MYEDRSLISLFPSATDVPEAMRVRPEQHPACMLIDGVVRRITAEDQLDPIYSRVAVRDGDALRAVLVGFQPRVSAPEAGEALAAAERAWSNGAGVWPAASIDTRIAAVERFSAKLGTLVEPIANLLAYEIGKPLAAGRNEVTRSIAYITETIAAMRRIANSAAYIGQAGSTTHHARDLKYPLGRVLCVAPFNYPINEFLTTIVPALLAGNVVIAKTPRFGVLANQLLMDAFAEAFPPGVVGLLPGDGRVVLPALISARSVDVFGNPRGAIDVLAFIGSEQAAHAILSQHPTPSFVHKILGLGAKNAAVVLEDANLDDAVAKLVKGALGFNGQRCTAEKLIFVPATKAGDAFVKAFGERVAKLPVGMPWDPAAAITPLPEERKLEWMWGYQTDAIEAGAELVNPDGGRGFHSIIRPAVLDRIGEGMRLYHEEQFGPIVPIARYTKLDDVIEWHHQSPYGQQAGVFGAAGPERSRLVSALAPFVARLNVNDVCQRGPDTFGFTATDKSGFGTLSIDKALESFSRTMILQSPDPSALA